MYYCYNTTAQQLIEEQRQQQQQQNQQPRVDRSSKAYCCGLLLLRQLPTTMRRMDAMALAFVIFLSSIAWVPIAQGPSDDIPTTTTGTGSSGDGGGPPLSSSPSSKVKVFGAGLSKTGTTSMAAAFDMIGYNTLHTDRTLSHFMHHYNETANMTGWYDDVDSSWDIPTAGYYKEIFAAYPDAKFILTTRESESWYKSFTEFINGYMIYRWGCKVPIRVQRLHTKIYGSPFPNRDWIRTYEQHNNEVKAFFAKYAPGQLLVLDIHDPKKFEKICPFIGSDDGPCGGYSAASSLRARRDTEHDDDTTPQPFPHANKFVEKDFQSYCPDLADGATLGAEVVRPVKEPGDRKFAYAMSLCDPSSIDQVQYVRMLLVLKESIRQFDRSSDIFVMIYGRVKGQLWQILEAEGFKVERVGPVANKAISNPAPPITNDRMAKCYTSKLRCLQLAEYDRVIYLDNNIILKDSIRYMFFEDRPLFAFEGIGAPLNASVFSVEPSDQAFSDIADFARSDGFDLDRGWLDVGPFPHWHDVGQVSNWSFYGASVHHGLLYYYYDILLNDVTTLPSHSMDDVLYHFGDTMTKPLLHVPPKNYTGLGKHMADGISKWWRLWGIVEARLKRRRLSFYGAFDMFSSNNRGSV